MSTELPLRVARPTTTREDMVFLTHLARLFASPTGTSSAEVRLVRARLQSAVKQDLNLTIHHTRAGEVVVQAGQEDPMPEGVAAPPPKGGASPVPVRR